MLLDNGKHPYTNEQVVPSHVVEHVATGATVGNGKAPFPELVGSFVPPLPPI
jgi:hypothetical protein